MANYVKERTPGTAIFNVRHAGSTTTKGHGDITDFFVALTGSKSGAATSNIFNANNSVKLRGKTYTLKNVNGDQDTAVLGHSYNLYDMIAVAIDAGYSYNEIDNALKTANLIDTGSKFQADRLGLTVSQYMNQNTVPSINNIATKLNTAYPGLRAYIVTTLDDDGITYTYTLKYTGLDGKPYSKTIDPSVVQRNGNVDEAALNNWLRDNGINTVVNNGTNILKNAQADWDMADAVLKKLNSVTYANSSNTLTDADRAAITAALPSTDNLTAWNAGKDANIFNTLIKNLNSNNPEVLERLSLEQLEDIANVVSGEQQKITERNINNKRTQLLQDIAKYPNLYDSLVQQQRADNAAGTIAGQRAANAQAIASEANAEYDSQAAELYKSLFSGEKGNVAQGTYNDTYSANVAASDQPIQGQIDALFKAAQDEAITMQELSTLLNAVGSAVGVDVSRYADEIAENQAAAGGKATELLKRIESDVNTQIAAGQANINTIKNLWQEQSSYSSQAKDGSANIQSPSDALKNYLNTLNLPSGGGYTKVSAGDYKKADRFENQHYDDVVNEEFLNWILSDETIDSFTKAKTIKEFLGQDLADTLTVEGLKKLYEGYNTEATEQSNKVFNQAQRAYIAAITAGDVKTADQLVRLATSASTSKGNLFAASALANQFKQQSGLSANGRQLATDFLNQQSFNHMNQAKQATAADAALGKYYYGTGSGDPNQKTVSGAYNIHAQNKATGYDEYGKLGNMLMGYNQDMSSYNVKNSIDNYDRLAQIAAGITGINATAASANKGIQGDKDYLTGAAAAKKAMAEQINPNLKK